MIPSIRRRGISSPRKWQSCLRPRRNRHIRPCPCPCPGSQLSHRCHLDWSKRSLDYLLLWEESPRKRRRIRREAPQKDVTSIRSLSVPSSLGSRTLDPNLQTSPDPAFGMAQCRGRTETSFSWGFLRGTFGWRAPSWCIPKRKVRFRSMITSEPWSPEASADRPLPSRWRRRPLRMRRRSKRSWKKPRRTSPASQRLGMIFWLKRPSE